MPLGNTAWACPQILNIPSSSRVNLGTDEWEQVDVKDITGLVGFRWGD